MITDNAINVNETNTLNIGNIQYTPVLTVNIRLPDDLETLHSNVSDLCIHEEMVSRINTHTHVCRYVRITWAMMN